MILRKHDTKEIQDYIKKLQQEVDSILKECISLTYFMRGGMQYEDSKIITVPERRVMHEYLSERMEQEAKKSNPIY